LHGAKLAAAHRGELRHPLPVGFLYDENGLILKDPDEQVHGAVADLFAEFHRTGSALRVVRAFAETGRSFPQRAWGGAWAGKLKWGRLTHARVLQALKNPTYAGAYTFGKSRDVRKVQPDGSVRTSRRRRAREEWTVLIEDHHEGYLSWQEYLAVEAKLAANNTQKRARPVREGVALCQGIIFCGICGGRVGTRYDRRDRKVSYTCQVKDSARTPQCRTIDASTVDNAVGELFLNTVTAQQIGSALTAAEEVVDRHTRTHRAAELAVQRARYDADRAERAFSNVEPENRLVARTLEFRWETKLAALAESEAALATPKATKPPLPATDSLRSLAGDLPRLWHADTTSPRDRKRLLRTLIADIALLPESDPHTMRVGVRWHTGATDELTIARPGPGRTPVAALGSDPPSRCYSHQHRDRRVAQHRGPDHRQGQAVHRLGRRKSPRRLQDLRPPNRRRPRRRDQRQTGRRRTWYPRRCRLQLAATWASTRPAGSQRTLVHPLGFRDAGDLPAEGRQLVPAQTDTSDAAQANATDGNRPLIPHRHTTRHAWPWPPAAVERFRCGKSLT
jgi:Recombinase/Recombinase zinc beta ribbon domain